MDADKIQTTVKGGVYDNMGTDVYLEWEGKPEKEAPVCTGYVIDDGYLRACVSMVRENSVLRMLFPEKYWCGRSREAFDFKGSFEQLSAIGWRYLVSVVKGVPFEIARDQQAVLEEQREMCAAILQSITSQMPEGARIGASELTEFRDAVAWLEAVFSFFELGIGKQEQGLKPYPYISW